MEVRSHWLARPYVVTAILVAIAVLIACPDYRRFRPYAGTPWAERALDWKSDHPFSAIPVERFAAGAGPEYSGVLEHLRKRTYRITVPILAKLSGIGLRGFDVLQQVTSCLFLLIVFLLFNGIFKDWIAALFSSVAIAASFAGQWGFNDFTYFDGIAYFLLAVILWVKRPMAVPILVVMAGFIDERAILAAPIIYLLQDGIMARLPGRRTLAPNRLRIGTIVGVAAFLALRVALGMHLGTVGDRSGVFSVMAFRYNLLVLPLALFLLFKGVSVLIGTSALVLAKQKALGYGAVFILSVLPCVVAGMLVYDLSRSLGYAFPCIFVCARIVASELPVMSIRRVALCAGILSMSMPTYYILLGLHPLLPVFRLL